MRETNLAYGPYTKRRPCAQELTEDLTATETIEILEGLHFASEHRLLAIDRGTRDYLLRALKRR